MIAEAGRLAEEVGQLAERFEQVRESGSEVLVKELFNFFVNCKHDPKGGVNFGIIFCRFCRSFKLGIILLVDVSQLIDLH